MTNMTNTDNKTTLDDKVSHIEKIEKMIAKKQSEIQRAQKKIEQIKNKISSKDINFLIYYLGRAINNLENPPMSVKKIIIDALIKNPIPTDKLHLFDKFMKLPKKRIPTPNIEIPVENKPINLIDMIKTES